jgi:hypothetical protein
VRILRDIKELVDLRLLKRGHKKPPVSNEYCLLELSRTGVQREKGINSSINPPGDKIEGLFGPSRK